MSTRYGRTRFEHRFYRGYQSQPAEEASEYCKRVCPCGEVHLGLREKNTSLCFSCGQVNNEYAKKCTRMSVDAAGEDSTNPQRIADGTAGINLGLRGVDKIVGTRSDGKPQLEYRPVANHEIASSRKLKEYAKRNGQTMLETPKRAIGGR